MNEKGYGLYIAFRPESEGWGKKAEMSLSSILELRRHLTHTQRNTAGEDNKDEVKPVIKFEDSNIHVVEKAENEAPPIKKLKKEEDTYGDEFDSCL